MAEAVALIKEQHFGPSAPLPCDAVGGICDGGLIAALIAQRTPSLRLLLNFCGGGWEVLPAELRERCRSVPIRVASIHVLSWVDEVYSQPSLLSLVEACEEAMLLRHGSGHAVPPLTKRMRGALTLFLATADERTSSGSCADGMGTARGRSLHHRVQIEPTCAAGMLRQDATGCRPLRREPSGESEGDSEGGRYAGQVDWGRSPGVAGAGGDGGDGGEGDGALPRCPEKEHGGKHGGTATSPLMDSLLLMTRAGGGAAAQQHLAVHLLSFFAGLGVLIHHYRPWMCSRREAMEWGAADVCAPPLRALDRALLHSLMPCFCLISGLQKAQRRPSARSSARQALALVAICAASYFLVAPSFVRAVRFLVVQEKMDATDPRLMCGAVPMFQSSRHLQWMWFLYVLAAYKAVDAGWAALQLPDWAMGCVAALLHIACAGGRCPFPFCLGLVNAVPATSCPPPGWLPSLHLHFSNRVSHLTQLWPYYCLLPLLLPRNFPDTLPIERHALPHLRRLLARWGTDSPIVGRPGASPPTVRSMGEPVAAVASGEGAAPTLVRFVWVALALATLLLPDGAGRYHVQEPSGQAAPAAVRGFCRIALLLVAGGAMMPRGGGGGVGGRVHTFAAAGANPLSFYLLHMLVCPLVHPYPWLYVLADAVRGGIKSLPVALSNETCNAVVRCAYTALVSCYLVGLRVALSRVPAFLLPRLSAAWSSLVGCLSSRPAVSRELSLVGRVAGVPAMLESRLAGLEMRAFSLAQASVAAFGRWLGATCALLATHIAGGRLWPFPRSRACIAGVQLATLIWQLPTTSRAVSRGSVRAFGRWSCLLCVCAILAIVNTWGLSAGGCVRMGNTSRGGAPAVSASC